MVQLTGEIIATVFNNNGDLVVVDSDDEDDDERFDFGDNRELGFDDDDEDLVFAYDDSKPGSIEHRLRLLTCESDIL